jgi:hypothetical protein
MSITKYVCCSDIAAACVNTVVNLEVGFHGQMSDYCLFKNCVPWTSFIQYIFLLG